MIRKKERISPLLMRNDYNSKVKALSLLILILLIANIAFAIFCQPLLAADKTKAVTTVDDFRQKPGPSNGIAKIAWKWVLDVYGGQSFSGAEDALAFNPSNPGGKYANVVSGIWTSAKTIYDSLEPIGYILLVLYFMIDLLEKVTHENFNIEHLFKSMLKLLLGYLVIANGWALLTDIIALFGNFKGDSGTMALSNEAIQELQDYYDSLVGTNNSSYFKGMGTGFLVILKMLFPWLIVGVCTILVNVVAWGRMIEIAIRGALAPLALCDMFIDGTRSAGFRYLKKLAAVGLRAAVILIILQLYSSLSISQTGFLGAITGTIISSVVVCSLIIKSQSFANEIMGV